MKKTASILLALSAISCKQRGSRSSDLARAIGKSNFIASPGDYFPPSVIRLFPAAKEFNSGRRTVVEARRGFNLIQVRRISDTDEPHNESNLDWSGDGQFLSYESSSEMGRSILLKSIISGRVRIIHSNRAVSTRIFGDHLPTNMGSVNSGLIWANSSPMFAYVSNSGTGDFDIFMASVGSDHRPLAKSPHKEGHISWSPDESQIAFVSSRSGNGDIYIAEVNGSNLSLISQSQNSDLYPVWSPNGDSIVYSSGSGPVFNIFRADRIGNKWMEPIQLTNWTRTCLRPIVSPDGQHIAFYANEGSMWNIHVLSAHLLIESADATGTIVARDVVVDLSTGPTWTPNSEVLLYVKHDTSKGNPIVGYHLITGASFRLDTGTTMNHDVRMSKDGLLSFRALVGAWDRVFVALTNQGQYLQDLNEDVVGVHYIN